MEITVEKYVTGTYVETFRQTVTIPDNISQEQIDDEVDLTDGEAVVAWLEENGLLQEDWGDSVRFDDNDNGVEFEVVSINPEPET